MVKDLQKETLRETGIQNCDVVVVCIGDKVDVSILTTLNVINLVCPRWWPRPTARNRARFWRKSEPRWYILKETWQSAWPGDLSPSVYSISFELDQNVDISEIKTTRKLTGQSVRDAQLRNRYGINIIAITRGGWLTTDVSPDYVFQDEDTVIVIGEREKIKRLADDLAR